MPSITNAKVPVSFSRSFLGEQFSKAISKAIKMLREGGKASPNRARKAIAVKGRQVKKSHLS
jgi:hypothetical protein